MDPFLDSITSVKTADPLFGTQNARKEARLKCARQRERLEKYSIHESHNRQVVYIEAYTQCIAGEYDIYNPKRGSGVLIHNIRNSLSDIDCFDWVCEHFE